MFTLTLLWLFVKDRAHMGPIPSTRLAIKLKWESVRVGPTMVDEDVAEVRRTETLGQVERMFRISGLDFRPRVGLGREWS